MIASSSQTQQAAVLYCEFADQNPARIVEAPLRPQETHGLVAAVAQRVGRLLESSSRRLYAAFARTEDALSCATEVRRQLTLIRQSDPARANLGFRILLGFGLVTLVQGRLRSDWTVRLPALTAQLPADGVGATPAFAAQLGTQWQPWLQELSGSRDPLLLIAHPEAGQGMSRIAATLSTPAQARAQTTLVLRVGGVPQMLRPADCPVHVGRDAACRVAVDGLTASRLHGRIDYSEGRFQYTDTSRNGSFVLTPSGEELFLLGETLALVGEGAISPGAPLSQQDGTVVRYACLSGVAPDPGGDDDETRPMRLG